MIKIHLIYWINLLCFFVCFIVAIDYFLMGNIIKGITEIIIGVFLVVAGIWGLRKIKK